MSKTNNESMQPEVQAPEASEGLKLDVRVRPIAPMGNLLAFANVTIGGAVCQYAFHPGRERELERCVLACNGGFPQTAQ